MRTTFGEADEETIDSANMARRLLVDAIIITVVSLKLNLASHVRPAAAAPQVVAPAAHGRQAPLAVAEARRARH